MYLYSSEKFEDIKWTYTNEEIEADEFLTRMETGFTKTCTLTTSDRSIELRNYYIREIKLTSKKRITVSEITDISPNTITFKVWNTEKENYEETTINKSDIEEVKFTLAYWRKANQIHAWFVNEVQQGVDDCNEYKVSGSQLNALIELCKEVLEKRNDNFSSANLPTQAGFFFGDTEYTDYYYSKVEDTIKQLSNIKTNGIYSYESSW